MGTCGSLYQPPDAPGSDTPPFVIPSGHGLTRTESDEKHLRSNNRSQWKHRPTLCYPEPSRGICSSAGPSWKCVSRKRLGIEARRACPELVEGADCQTSVSPVRQGWGSMPQPCPNAVGAARSHVNLRQSVVDLRSLHLPRILQ
jgi:hypothetical protein